METATEGFGRAMRNLREAHGWTVLELAAGMGVSPQRVYQLERLATHPTRPATVQRVADALGVDVTDLTGGGL